MSSICFLILSIFQPKLPLNHSFISKLLFLFLIKTYMKKTSTSLWYDSFSVLINCKLWIKTDLFINFYYFFKKIVQIATVLNKAQKGTERKKPA